MLAENTRATPSAMTVCTSWPQACIFPASFEANGRPVCSWIGSASMSARMPMVRPGLRALQDGDHAGFADPGSKRNAQLLQEV